MSKLREAAIELLKSAPDHIDGHWPELDEVVKALAQGKQEPVAWTLTEFLDKRETTTNAPLWFVDPVNSAWTPLYTAPPSKRWASLTDEEIEEAANNAGFGHINIALEIEAKLKEKNHD